MKCRLLFLLLLLPFTGIQAQWTITGRVTDENGETLPGTTLSADDRWQTTTDGNGAFRLSCTEKPRELAVRCIGYFPRRIAVDTLFHQDNKALLDVELQSSALNLSEVAITAKPMEQIFEEDFRTNLLDFCFAGSRIVLLVQERKNYGLWLTDDDGRVLSKLRLPVEILRLHRSCTGNFHAVGTAVCWEFTLHADAIDTFPRYPATQFHRLVEPCVLEKDGYYVFGKTGPLRQSVQYMYYDPDRKPHLLAVVRDKVNEELLLNRYRSILAEYMKTIPDVDRDDILNGKTAFTDPMQLVRPENLVRMAESNELLTAIGFLSQLAEDSVYAPLVRVNEHIYLLDHLNDKLLRFDLNPWEDGAISLRYHHAPGWKKEVLVDAPLQRIYGRFGTPNGQLVFREINLETGEAGKSYRPTIAPYLADHFKLRNGMLYFIGQPDVNVPNRVLYKVNLFKFLE